MKKGLFLLPLVGFMLGGCSIFGLELGGSSSNTSSNTSSNSNAGTGTNTNNNNSGSNTNGSSSTATGGGEKGTGLSTVTLYNKEDLVDASASPLVFTDKGCKVTVGIGSNSNNSLSDAISASKTFEFRIYNKFSLKVEADTQFTKLVVLYSTYVSNGSTFYFDFDVTGAEKVLDNEYDTANTTGKATYTFASGVTSYDFGDLHHQTRVRSIEFVA